VRKEIVEADADLLDEVFNGRGPLDRGPQLPGVT
jgi:hypothetical protein